MTKKNKQLLQLLKQNARYTHQELSGLTGESVEAVKDSIDQLMSDGIIRQFTTVINDNDLIDVPIKALVELSICPEKGAGYDAIANRISGFSNVVSHYLVSGAYDFLVVVEGADHKDIAHFVFDKLATLENVKSTTTHFIFKAYKEQGVILEELSEVQRVPILP
jgi:DNA-binding Lrp family transcriptional regulator